MLMKLIKWFHGYLLVVIKSYSPERFLNLCRNRNILIWNLRKTEAGYEFNISLKGYLELRPIVRKTKTLPIIKKRYGLPFYLHKYKKRKVFFVGILIAGLLIYYMSLFIWDVEISGQYTHTEEAMIKFLNNTGVYAGVMKKEVNCQEIEETIRKQYTDIGWVSAEIRGTRLLIKITETNMPKPHVQQTEPCHIVADKDGIIRSIITRTGVPKVKIGDVVKKGDILVSGVVEIYGDDQSVIKRNPVIADADIIIKSFYEYKNEFPLAYDDKVYTQNIKKYYSLNLFGFDMYFLNPFKDYSDYEKYDHIVSASNLKLNKNFYLPVIWSKIENKEYQLVSKVYSEEEALKKAQDELNLYISKLEECDVMILENQVVYTITDEKMIAEGKLIVEEPIRETRPVSEEESYVEPVPSTPTE